MSLEPRHALLEITRARLLEFVRQPEALFWVFGFPVLLAVVLGLAFRNRPLGELPVAVVGEGAAADRLVATLDASPLLAAERMAGETAARALRTAKVDLVVEPGTGAGGGAGVASGAPAHGLPPARFRFDPRRAEARTARLAAGDALQSAAGRRDPLAVEAVPVRERGQRYVDFLIPGLIGLNLMSGALWGFSFAIVQMRGGKLLRRLAATPMRRLDFLIGLMCSRLVFFALQVVFLLVFGWLAFGVEVHGSPLDIALLGTLATFAFTAIALLVSSRVKTIEGASGLSNLVMIPMWLFSGTFFSYERFPRALQPAIRALPLTAFNDAIRMLVNDGLRLAAAWPQLAVLLFWTVVPLALALRLFRWQ